MPKAKRLSEASVQRIKPPSSGQMDYFDAIIPGFALRVTRRGTKSWSFTYRIAGKQRRLTLGRYPVLTLENARSLARMAFEHVQAGIDPRATRENASQEANSKPRDTFGAIADLFIEKHAKQQNKTWQKTQYNLKKYVEPCWGEKPIASITRLDAIELIESIADQHGPFTANYVRANLRKLFSWACKRDLAQMNPVVDVERPISAKKAERDRVLSTDEIRSVWKASESLGYPFGPFIKLLFLTAQRRTEVARMRLSDVNLNERLWTLSKGQTKAGRSHDVPLSETAMEVLGTLPHFTDGDFLFTSTCGVKPINGFSKVKANLDRLSKVRNWRLHDIRRTAGTCMTERLGTTEFIVGRVLNHAQSGVTSIYVRASYLNDKRAALEEWGRLLHSIVAE